MRVPNFSHILISTYISKQRATLNQNKKNRIFTLVALFSFWMSSMLNHALPWIYHGFKWRMVPSYSTHHHHIKVNTVRRFNKVICLVVINYWTLSIINLHEDHKQGWRVPATRKIHVTGDKSICKIRIHIIRSGWRITA